MNNKISKEIGFSMNELNEDTVLIEGISYHSTSKKSKIKNERQYSKVNLHLFDKEYIEKLQQIELNLKSQTNVKVRLLNSLEKLTILLMK